MPHRFWQEIRAVFREEMSVSELLDPQKAGTRLRMALLLVREIYRSIRQDRAVYIASALAYKSLLALVPVLAISLSVVAMIPESEAGLELTHSEAVIQSVRKNIPQFHGKEDLVASLRTLAENARLIAQVSFLFLFVTVFLLLSNIEDAFNIIWQVRGRRPLLGRLGAYVSTMLLVPILMSVSVYLTAQIESAARDVSRGLPGFTAPAEETPPARDPQTPPAAETPAPGAAPPPPATATEEPAPAAQPAPEAETPKQQSLLVRLVLVLFGLGMTGGAMFALYYLLPYTPVRVRAALVGAATTAVALELAKFLFQYYALRWAENYTQVYGALLALPLFLVWLWLVWILVLVGAEVSFVIQNFRDLAARAEMEKRGIQSRLYLAVRIVQAASDRFHRGEDPGNLVDAVAEQVNLPPYMVREVVSTLVERGVLRQAVPGEDLYLPGKDISVLTIGEVVRAVMADRFDVPEAPDDPLRRYLDTLFTQTDRAIREILDTRTLADLVALAGGWADEEETVTVPEPSVDAAVEAASPAAPPAAHPEEGDAPHGT
jgi:membrane protein